MRIFTAFLFLGVALVTSGCMAHSMPSPRGYNRLALVEPPPFQPGMLMEGEREPITVLAMSEDSDFETIEPAAGQMARYMDNELPAKPACKIGSSHIAGEAVSYGWSDARLGIGFDGSSVRQSEIDGAVLRFSVSLAPKSIKKKQACDHSAAWREIGDGVWDFTTEIFE